MASMLDKIVKQMDLRDIRKLRISSTTQKQHVVQEIRRVIRVITQRGFEVPKDEATADTKIGDLETPTSEGPREVRMEDIRPGERSGTPSPDQKRGKIIATLLSNIKWTDENFAFPVEVAGPPDGKG